MTPISFTCAGCAKRLKVNESLQGKCVLCPGCKVRLVVPSPQKEEEATAYAIAVDPPKETAGGDMTGSPVVKSSEAKPPSSQSELRMEPKVRPKKRKLTKDERILVEETPWVVRYLHWVLLAALIPLIVDTIWDVVSPGRGQLSVDQRLEETLSQFSEEEREKLEDRIDARGGGLDAVFRALPGHKLAGAWLERKSWMHWVLAVFSSVFFFLFFFVLCSRGTAKPKHLILAGLFTATIGIVLLFAVQVVAMMSRATFINPIAMAFLWIFRFIGNAYYAALDPNSSFFLCWIGCTFGIGLCEELCKAIPVVYYVKRNKSINWHGAFLWGLASGAGFGISEGIHYSGEMYNGIAGGDVYMLRFISCVALHALWSGTVGMILYLFRGKMKEMNRWHDTLAFIFMACGIPIILHGLYDTFLFKEMHLGALIVALMSFGFLALVDRYLHSTRGVTLLRSTR